MKSISITCLALALLVGLPGCRSSAEKAQAKQEKQQQQAAALKASIPPDSPLAKLEMGMSEGEVTAILGQPSSQDMHTTGKQFIPFNYAGKDTMRTVYYFKGVGRVEFSSGSWGQRNGLVGMVHDPEDPGYRRSK